MNAPPLLIGAALAFWGWQSGNLVVGALLGAALEALRAFRLRIDLGVNEHSTIADLSTIGFVLLAVLLAANRGIGRGILEAFTWQPIVLSPIIAAQLVTADRRIPLSALFRYMRKLRREHPDVKDPPVDVSAVYAALTLLAAGIANQRGPEYYIAVVGGTGLLLYAARPRGRGGLAAAALLLSAAAVLGHVAHVGLAHAQLLLVDWVLDLNMRTIDPDPYRSRTELGSLGRLKKYDAIVLRVYADAKDAARVQLLHRGSYNTYVAGIWVARGASMDNLDSEADNETWVLERDPQQGLPPFRVRMSARFETGHTLLPLPAGTTRIASFPATQMRRNALGAAHASLTVDWANYEAQAVPGIAFYAPPTAEDSAVPAEERRGPGGRRRRAGPARTRAGGAAAPHRKAPRELRLLHVPRPAGAGGRNRTRRFPHAHARRALRVLRHRGDAARARRGRAGALRHRLCRHRVQPAGRRLGGAHAPRARLVARLGGRPLAGPGHHPRKLGRRGGERGAGLAGSCRPAALRRLSLVPARRIQGRRRLVRGARRPRRLSSPGACCAGGASCARKKPPPPRAGTIPARTPSSTPWRNPCRRASRAKRTPPGSKRIASGIPAKKLNPIQEALRLHQRYRFDPAGLSRNERNRLRELCRSLAPTSRGPA